MNTIALRKTPSRKRRAGRPPRELAGEVDARILDAARTVFFERGLAGASMDEIAARAGAGKPTIYARFRGKEALFAAVVMRNVETKIAQFQTYLPSGASLEERLANAGGALLRWVLVADTIGLMRLSIAEAPRFPELASSVGRMARERGAEAVAQLLVEVARSDEPEPVPAFTPERLPNAARLLLDLILLPLVMRALQGTTLDELRAEIDAHVARSVAFFLAGYLHGGDEWPKSRS